MICDGAPTFMIFLFTDHQKVLSTGSLIHTNMPNVKSVKTRQRQRRFYKILTCYSDGVAREPINTVTLY